MTSDRDDVRLSFELFIDAPPEVVWGHFTDPVRLASWMGRYALLDPRSDGAWSLDVNGRDIVAGRYIEVDRPNRLRFTWGWKREGEPFVDDSIVEVTFTPDGEGTRLVLLHSGLPDGLRERHAGGWNHYLARLSLAALGADPGPDPLDDPSVLHGA